MRSDSRAPLSRRHFCALAGTLLAAPAAAVASAEEELPEAARLFGDYDGAFVLRSMRDGRTLRYQPKRCAQRFAPCSTFKIPNSLIGLETGVIPSLDYEMKWDGKKRHIESHNRDHTLRTAYRDSVLWYYERLAERVGTERMRRFVREFRYGDQNVPDGGEQFWLDALTISPNEQVEFLERFYRYELPVSRRTMEQVREIMVAEKTERGTLRGKTGTQGYAKDGKLFATYGWYVGWVEHDGTAHLFAAHLSGGENPIGFTARQVVTELLRGRGLL
ncbi:MAG: penicillin-binding transpeptidase domain-containing protein [Armatimonadota bacterium]